MFWADEFLKGVKGRQHINDSWTPSGAVHMGSLKGPVIHDVLFRILQEKNIDVVFTFGIDDADPLDGLPPDLSHLSEFLGMPLFMVPSPDGNGSFADYFGNKMIALQEELGIKPQRYKTSELYKKGGFNKAIRLVLDSAQEVRDVYSRMYKKEIAKDWFPFQVICPYCKKVGTSKVTGWDGKEVRYHCSTGLVKWAKGCGKSGTISPFDGNGKMPWKVEWAAKWWTFPVTIEAAGKDHGSAGGSYDVAMEIVKDVFKSKTPTKLVYEFFLSRGKKMSSSKGIGLSGQELLEVLGPQRSRFLMIKTAPNQQVEFTPYNSDSIPKVFDDYIGSADEKNRAFELSQIEENEKVPPIRFSLLTQWVQMPNMEQEIKKQGLTEWAKYARIWVEKYAPESEKFLVQKIVPQAAKNLHDKQKSFLKKVAIEVSKKWRAEEFQVQLYEWVKEVGISSKEAFSAIYTSLIGKDHGPKAGWLILSLDKKFVKKRFTEDLDSLKSPNNPRTINVQNLNHSEIFSIDANLKAKFPSISVGVAVIKGVKIEKMNPQLEKEKEKLLGSLSDLTTEQLGQYPEVQSYRRLYKEMGVDWHSRRPSPEALLRRVALKKGLYAVNTCVDAYNLIVMKHRVSVGAFDEDKIQYPTVLRLAKEGESILLLGDEEPTKYSSKDIAYFDREGGINMDFNYRDAQRTAVQLSTQNLYINVDGVYDIPPQRVEEILKETCDIIIKYCGGTLEAFGIETSL